MVTDSCGGATLVTFDAACSLVSHGFSSKFIY